MNDYTRAERRLEVTHSVKLPEKVRAWWFLRRSGITKEQRQLILTNTGTSGLTIEDVMKAMSFILGQDSKLDSGRWNRTAKMSDAYYHDDGETQYDWAGHDDGVVTDPAYYQDEYAGEDWADDGQDYYGDEAYYAESGEAVYDVEEFDEVFANYQDAKAKLNALRTSRGFFPVVAIMPDCAGSSPGNLVRSKGRGRGKPSKGKGKQQMPKGKPPNPKARASAAMGSGRQLCLRCGNAGHWARNCPMPPGSDKKRKIEDESGVNMVADADVLDPNEVPVNVKASELIAISKNDQILAESASPLNAQVTVNDMATEETFHIDGDYVSDDTAMQDGGAASVLGSARHSHVPL